MAYVPSPGVPCQRRVAIRVCVLYQVFPAVNQFSIRWRYEKVAITTYLHVVHLCCNYRRRRWFRRRRWGLVRKGIIERIRCYIWAVAVRRSWGARSRHRLVLGQLSSTVRLCRSRCEPEIAENVKFWPVPSQRQVVFLANSYRFFVAKDLWGCQGVNFHRCLRVV